jgi:hypothetical protein
MPACAAPISRAVSLSAEAAATTARPAPKYDVSLHHSFPATRRLELDEIEICKRELASTPLKAVVIVAVAGEDDVNACAAQEGSGVEQVVETLFVAHVSTMQSDELIRHPAQAAPRFGDSLGRFDASRAVSQSLDLFRRNSSGLEIASEPLGDDADAARSPGERKLGSTNDACHPLAAGHPALLGRQTHQILEDEAVWDAVEPGRGRGMRSSREAGAGPEDDVWSPTAWKRRQTEGEERELVKCPLRGRLRARDVMPPPPHGDSRPLFCSGQSSGGGGSPIGIVGEACHDHDVMAGFAEIFGDIGEQRPASRRFRPVVRSRDEHVQGAHCCPQSPLVSTVPTRADRSRMLPSTLILGRSYFQPCRDARGLE